MSSHIPKPTRIAKPSTQQSLEKIASATGNQVDLLNASGRRPNDNDSAQDYKVGDRVYVGGTKLGTIAFLGETQFADNLWAGIVLDEPLGKNDGSVAEISYFQCKPMHGIFSRPSRLSRYPMTQYGLPSHIPSRKTSRIGRSSSPTESTASNVTNDQRKLRSRSPSPTGSMLSTISKSDIGIPKIGDRVIVSSAKTGSKTGTLRFVGETEFSPGEWAGIELDGPVGKNDGTVGEKRYFECKPNYGIFAPLSKVTKSPRNRMTRQPSNLSSTPSRHLCRQKSNASDISNVSVISSASRTVHDKKRSISSITAPETLRTSLKEKELKIEQLMKERELERAEIAKAANQTDQAEINLSNLRQEFETYKENTSEQEKKNALLIKKLNDELLEERQKNEDLLFRMEEEAVMRGDDESDLKARNEEYEREMKNLQAQTDSLKNTIEELKTLTETLNNNVKEKEKHISALEEENSNMAFESEEKSVTLYAEIEELKSRVESYRQNLDREKSHSSSVQDKVKMDSDMMVQKVSTLERALSEKETQVLELTHKLESSTKSLNSTNANLENMMTDIKTKDHQIQELTTKSMKIESELLSVRADKELYTGKVEDALRTLEQKETELKTVSKELTNLEKSLESKSRENKELKARLEQDGSNSAIELQKKIEENQTLRDSLKEMKGKLKDVEIQNSDLNEKRAQEEMKCADMAKDLNNLKDMKEGLEKEIAALRDGSQLNDLEVKRLSGCLVLKDNEMETLRNDVSSLLSQLNTLKDVITQNENEAKEVEAKLLKEHNKELQELQAVIKKKEQSLEKSDKSKNDAIAALNEKVKNIHEENEEAVSKLKIELIEAVSEKDRAIEQLKLAIEEAETAGKDKISQVEEAKKQTEMEIEEKNLENIRKKDREVSELSKKLSEMSANLERLQEELKTETTSKLDLQEQFETLKRTNDEEMGELVDVVNDLKDKEDELKVTLEELEVKAEKLVKLQNEVDRRDTAHSEELSRIKASSQAELDTVNEALEESKKQILYLKESMASAKVDHDLRVDKMEKELEVLKDKYERELDKKDLTIQKLRDEVSAKELELEVLKEDLHKKEEECEQLSTDLEVKEASFNNSFKTNEESHSQEIEILVSKVEDAKAEISDLSETLAKLKAEHVSKVDELVLNKKNEVQSLQDMISERDRVIVDLKANVTDLDSKVRDLTLSSEDEAKISAAKIEKLSNELEEFREKKLELESYVKSLRTDYDQVMHQNEDLTITVVEKERQVKEFTSQVQTMKVTYEKTQKELTDRLERSVQESQTFDEMQNALTGERLRVDELQVALGEAETERDSLSEKLKDYDDMKHQLSMYEENERMLSKTIEDLKGKEEFLVKEFEAERKELNEVVQNSQIVLRDKIEEFKSQKREFEGLQSENVQLNSYKRNVLLLEQEKRELENKLANITLDVRNERSRSIQSNGTDESLQGQVDFLNSVIVDMQRKNDELKAKMELFESAGILNDDSAHLAFMLNGVSTNQVAPRLFCDICDRFDLHDTEDCPTQAMPSIVSGDNSHSKHSAPRGPSQRPYCDTCEVFGHSTKDCNEEETF